MVRFEVSESCPCLRPASGLRRMVLLAAFLGLSLGLATCCSGPQKEPSVLDDPRYSGWQYYTYKSVKIFHPPGHPQEANFEQIAAGYVRALEGVSMVLEAPVPTDTLVVVFYTGWGQGKEMTGREYPFSDGEMIHFWIPSHLGTTFMQWYLPRWIPQEPRHQFLKHGLISLFDYSGQDYHKATLQYTQNGYYIPLAELAVDTAIDSDTERLQSGEAASFVAFVIGTYGVGSLKGLYRSALPFDSAVQMVLGSPVDSLEQKWLDFARLQVPPDSLPEDSN